MWPDCSLKKDDVWAFWQLISAKRTFEPGIHVLIRIGIQEPTAPGHAVSVQFWYQIRFFWRLRNGHFTSAVPSHRRLEVNGRSVGPFPFFWSGVAHQTLKTSLISCMSYISQTYYKVIVRRFFGFVRPVGLLLKTRKLWYNQFAVKIWLVGTNNCWGKGLTSSVWMITGCPFM